MSIAERADWLCPPDSNDRRTPSDWYTRKYSRLRRRRLDIEPFDHLRAPALLTPRLRQSDSGGARAFPLGENTDMASQLPATLLAVHQALLDAQDEGEDLVAPRPGAVSRAYHWITALFLDAASYGAAWLQPHVVVNPVGEIVFNWLHRNRTLTVYVTEHSAEYVESWGTNIRTDMEDGNADSETTRRALWSRLMSN